MKKEKKIYEKPELEAIKMLEAGAQQLLCCRTTGATCSNDSKNTQGKTSRGNTAS